MAITRVYLFPVAAFVLIPATFIISYVMAVLNNHVMAGLPYISDTGALAPESCIFGQLVNIGSVLMGICIYLRHRQIVEFYKLAQHSYRWHLRFSTLFLCIGMLAALGTSMVANFQENRWLAMHLVGAFAAFGLGVIYCYCQTVFSFLMAPTYTRRWLCCVRLFLCLLSTACFISMFACGFLRNAQRQEAELVSTETPSTLSSEAPSKAARLRREIIYSSKEGNGLPVKFSEDDPGFTSHIGSTTSEWLLVFAFLLYFLTFAAELRHAVLLPPRLVISSDREFRPKDETVLNDELPHDNDADAAGYPSDNGVLKNEDV